MLLGQQMLDFVRQLVHSSSPCATELDEHYPFRNRFNHCLRVSLLAEKIARKEKKNAEVARIAGLFHDACKAVGRDHAMASADACRGYLEEHHPQFEHIDAVVDCVKNHSGHIPLSQSSYPDDAAILKDADLIDEVGTVGVVWTILASRGSAENPKSYYEVLDRLKRCHIGYDSKERWRHLRTDGGKLIMRKRIETELKFVKTLSQELFYKSMGFD
jgi:putative nucleotidyltransferase with HDIG domain